MQELEMLAASVAGITGIPLLISATKYTLLYLWSLEEALVETAALLDGKRLPVGGEQGRLALSEIFLFNGALVERKAAEIPGNRTGAGYEDYLTVFSLMEGVQKKIYRMMDVIQENIRVRYDDKFRIRNVVTSASFQTEAWLRQRVETGIWKKDVYRIVVQEMMAY